LYGRREESLFVILANAGIQCFQGLMDFGLRRNEYLRAGHAG